MGRDETGGDGARGDNSFAVERHTSRIGDPENSTDCSVACNLRRLIVNISPGRTKETSFSSAKKALFLGVKELFEAPPRVTATKMRRIEVST